MMVSPGPQPGVKVWGTKFILGGIFLSLI